MRGELFDDLPDLVRTKIEKLEADMQDVRNKTDFRVKQARQQAELEIREIETERDRHIKSLHERLVTELKPLQDSYIQEGKLDEALAIREQIRRFKSPVRNVRQDPGNLLNFHDRIGQTLFFEVVGNNFGPLWGNDVYTSDSNLGTAAVHAGALREGQKGIVAVEIIDTRERAAFDGASRNGVWSEPWGPYAVGFRISRV